MDGDIAPLDEITKLAREYGAMTYIDDCHGEGVLAGGRGIGAHFGVEDEVDMESGSFSKAFGMHLLVALTMCVIPSSFTPGPIAWMPEESHKVPGMISLIVLLCIIRT